MTRVLVLGASGMAGHTLFRFLEESPEHTVLGTVRSEAAAARLPASYRGSLCIGPNALRPETMWAVLDDWHPDVVINCIAVIKQAAEANDPLVALPLNALFPHQLARACGERGARLVHLSTDCVFDGKGSLYRETDFASADDLYGRSKFLGEVDYPNAITLRTSIIGHELGTRYGLLEWFLGQQGSVRGFRRAIYSGLTAPELAKVIRDYAIPRRELRGVYQVSSEVIDKYQLLLLLRQAYGKEIAIEPDDAIAIDRSLDSSRFRDITGYAPLPWIDQIREMRQFG
jgi:dTDP-4-dehydrorhamnose reductase